MYEKFANIFDELYCAKDYASEADCLIRIIDQSLSPGEKTLLDVGCGTGMHISLLRHSYTCEGLDLSNGMLAHARKRNPSVRFHQGDMADFDLGHEFDILLCLFGSIGYMKTLERTQNAIDCMVAHLNPGGLLLLEPWLSPKDWKAGSVHAILIDEPQRKIARLSTSLTKGSLADVEMHFLVALPEGTEHFVEHHQLLLLDREQLKAMLEKSGLDVAYDPTGLMDRGLFLGRMPHA